MKKRNYKKDVNLILKFENKKQRDEWIGWYLDGGGEQQADYYAMCDSGTPTWRDKNPFLILDRQKEDF